MDALWPLASAGGTAVELGVQLGTPVQVIPALGNGGSAIDSRFVRAAKTVGECLGRVKTLSERVNSASAFRESCSKLLGAAFAASLALQEVRGMPQSRAAFAQLEQLHQPQQ